MASDSNSHRIAASWDNSDAAWKLQMLCGPALMLIAVGVRCFHPSAPATTSYPQKSIQLLLALNAAAVLSNIQPASIMNRLALNEHIVCSSSRPRRRAHADREACYLRGQCPACNNEDVLLPGFYLQLTHAPRLALSLP